MHKIRQITVDILFGPIYSRIRLTFSFTKYSVVLGKKTIVLVLWLFVTPAKQEKYLKLCWINIAVGINSKQRYWKQYKFILSDDTYHPENDWRNYNVMLSGQNWFKSSHLRLNGKVGPKATCQRPLRSSSYCQMAFPLFKLGRIWLSHRSLKIPEFRRSRQTLDLPTKKYEQN